MKTKYPNKFKLLIINNIKIHKKRAWIIKNKILQIMNIYNH